MSELCVCTVIGSAGCSSDAVRGRRLVALCWLRRHDAKVPAAKRILTALYHCARAQQWLRQL